MAASMIERCPQNMSAQPVSFTLGFPRKFSLQYGHSSSLYNSRAEKASSPVAIPRVRRERIRSDPFSQPRLPFITEHGMRLGTPVAREAAKSFWSMDMLKDSLDRMVQCAERSETHSDSDSDNGSSVCLEENESTSLRLPLLTTSAPSFTSSVPTKPEPDATSENYSPSSSGVTLLQDSPATLLLVRRTNNGRRTSLTKSSRITLTHRSLSVDGRSLTIHSKETPAFKPARKTRSFNAVY